MLTRIKNLLLFRSKVLKSDDRCKINVFARMKAYRHGFTTGQYVRYDLKNNSLDQYLSEYDRWNSRKLNGPYNLIFDNKIIFYELFHGLLDIPATLAWINNGSIFDLKGARIAPEEFLSLLQELKQMVIKPISAGSGEGVEIIRFSGDQYYINTHTISAVELQCHLLKKNDVIVTEYVTQHAYASEMFDKTVNTIRVISVFDEDMDLPVILYAIHRIGTSGTIPVDNAKQGALVSLMNIQTGSLGDAKTMFGSRIYTHHPDSGAPITNTRVPFWAEATANLIRIHGMYPYIKLIAWDLVITADGYSVIEGNASTGFNILQLWNGVRESEFGVFLRKHKVIK